MTRLHQLLAITDVVLRTRTKHNYYGTTRLGVSPCTPYHLIDQLIDQHKLLQIPWAHLSRLSTEADKGGGDEIQINT